MIETIDCVAKAASHCRNKVIVAGDDNVGTSWNGDRGTVAAVAGPVEVPFGADDELTDLVIETDLPATDEHPVVVVEAPEKERVGPVIAGPSTANVTVTLRQRARSFGLGRSGVSSF